MSDLGPTVLGDPSKMLVCCLAKRPACKMALLVNMSADMSLHVL